MIPAGRPGGIPSAGGSMQPWLGHVGTFLLGLTLSVTFYEGRRLVLTTAEALSAASSLEEPEKHRKVDKRDQKKDRGDVAQRQRPELAKKKALDGEARDKRKAKRRRGGKAKVKAGGETPTYGRRRAGPPRPPGERFPTDPDLAAPLPDEGLPDEGLPDEGLPDEGLPDQGLPDEALPDEGLPEEPVE